MIQNYKYQQRFLLKNKNIQMNKQDKQNKTILRREKF